MKKYLILGFGCICLLLALGIYVVHADSNGPNNCASATDNTATGTVAWTNPSKACDGSLADWATAGGAITATSHYLETTNLSFSIPSGSTINGIVLEIVESASSAGGAGGSVKDSGIYLVHSTGTLSSQNKANAAVNWPVSSSAYVTYGSSSDLWGDSWTSSDINDSSFGAAISVLLTKAFSNPQASVPNVRITVYYTTASGSHASMTLTSGKTTITSGTVVIP